MAQMKEQNKTPVKELNDTEIRQPVRCRIQNTGAMDAQRTHWVFQKHKGKNERYIKWNKEKSTGTISGEEEARIQINDLEHNEEINNQPKHNEETRIKKTEKRIRRLWNISKNANIQIIGMPEGEEKEQKIENLFEKIMKKTSLIWQRK